MSSPNEPIRLEQSDLYSPKIEAYLEEQDLRRRPIPEFAPQPFLLRVLYSSYFYLSLTSGLGAFLAWALLEPFFDDMAMARGENAGIVNYLIFPTVAGMIGLFLGATEGLMCRNVRRAVISGLVGVGIGFGGGLVSIFAAEIVFLIMGQIALRFWKNPRANAMPDGIALLIFMMGRGAAWALAAIPAGIGQGIALRERKVILNGLVGAVLGGLLGGLLFDPISIFFNQTQRATISRAIGFTVIGLLVGFFVGLVEQWTKTAWLMMRAGPLAGKQFVLYRTPTILGSSPRADVYLFKDAAIEPRHAMIHNRGGRFEIEDCDTPDGTYVNGLPVRSHILQSGDQIVLGKTVLEFQLKDV